MTIQPKQPRSVLLPRASATDPKAGFVYRRSEHTDIRITRREAFARMTEPQKVVRV